jgi:hypothetical protein
MIDASDDICKAIASQIEDLSRLRPNAKLVRVIEVVLRLEHESIVQPTTSPFFLSSFYQTHTLPFSSMWIWTWKEMKPSNSGSSMLDASDFSANGSFAPCRSVLTPLPKALS